MAYMRYSIYAVARKNQDPNVGNSCVTIKLSKAKVKGKKT